MNLVEVRHMSSRQRGRQSRQWKRLGILVALLTGLALGGWLLFDYVRAWHHLDAGRDALECGELRLARKHLEICLRAWPRSAEVHYLAARAARRTGELEQANEHLDRAAEYGWEPKALDLERALWRVQTRDLPSVEAYLIRCLELRHPDSLLILEILGPAYLQNFQLDQAQRCIDQWIELDPNSASAWHARGILAERRQGRGQMIDSYLKALTIDPNRRDSRLGLARALLNANRPAEARLHLEELVRHNPDDKESHLHLSACYKALGKAGESREVLDRLLKQHPDFAEALHVRGKIALDLGDAPAAAEYLRRAVAKAPFDRELLYTWQRCLRQVGSLKEVQECQKRLEGVEADMRLLADLTGKVPGDPKNADLRFKCGEVLLRNGQEEEGVRWLRSALGIQPDHAASHRALAGYYEKKGDAGQAALHRENVRP